MGFIAYVVQRGVDATALCDEAEIDVDLFLRNDNVDITESMVQRLWRAASKLTGDPFFGLHLGESFQLAALGAVGEIIKSSDTVGKALTIASTFTPVVTTLYTMRVTQHDHHILVAFELTREEPSDIAQQVADFLMVFTTHELAGFLLRKITPIFIHYPFAVKDQKQYERIFQGAPIKKDEVLKIGFDASIWNEPIITANYEVQRFFLDRISTSNPSSNVSSFQGRIMEYLLKNAYHGVPSLEDVAANFNMTSRSLQRRLQQEGTTFQQTADAIRKTLALHYLESGNYKVKEVSNLLGYNEISAFSRAFKRWTGKAPVSYSA